MRDVHAIMAVNPEPQIANRSNRLQNRIDQIDYIIPMDIPWDIP